MARYSEKHYPVILQKEAEFETGDFKEAMRKSFLNVDESLKNGGLQEVAQMKKANPPAKSPLMKILQQSLKKNEEGGDGEEDDDLALDSIGCTANVMMIDYALKKLFVANAGDSRCVMGAGGKCTPMSFDHKPES